MNGPPVWWLARGLTLSPWKYSWKRIRSRSAVVLELGSAVNRSPPLASRRKARPAAGDSRATSNRVMYCPNRSTLNLEVIAVEAIQVQERADQQALTGIRRDLAVGVAPNIRYSIRPAGTGPCIPHLRRETQMDDPVIPRQRANTVGPRNSFSSSM